MASQTSDFDPMLRSVEHLERLKDSHEVLHARQDKVEDLLFNILDKLNELTIKLDDHIKEDVPISKSPAVKTKSVDKD